MAEFSHVINDFWKPPGAAEGVTIVVDPELAEDRRLTILTAGGGTKATMTPAMADRLALGGPTTVTEVRLRQALAEAGVFMHGADCLFYFTEEAKATLLDEHPATNIRQLAPTDAALFKAFEEAATEQDLDDAYVELDHWAVFGSFEGDRLAAAASSYPWGGASLADMGVLTLPAYRGKGHARGVVRAICRHAYGEGYEPQYRCQLDNHASRALAASAGLTQYGTWEVVENS